MQVLEWITLWSDTTDVASVFPLLEASGLFWSG